MQSQTVTSNLDLTGRKYAINFNLKVDSDQGRLDIYAWMITDKELYRNGGKALFTFSAVNLGRMAESKSRGLSVLSTAS